ncbi:MAG TPA: nucleotide sugar dehydrogenase [Anaerolineales bacterium]|nr:nucleotide sugar dehydrogenase [Anaerolineales bacterium]
MTIKSEFLNKVKDRAAILSVVGLGYVGLPLAVEFAKEGFKVIGIDLDKRKVDSINASKSYIPDVPTDDVAASVRGGKLSATTDYAALREADSVSICVPTPLRKTRDPDMSYVIASADEVAKYAHPGLLIVLESTTYPGTTDEILLPRLKQRGFNVGADVFLAFSPERIDPGNKTYGIRNTPKVVGGYTADCADAVHALYSTAINTVVKVTGTQAAEMVKLLENTFRAVNIGLVNEVAIMCDKLGVNVWEVIEAAKTKPFGFMPFYPGPGLGGHCIPIDPLYLSWRMKSFNYNARFIELADEINMNMPRHVVGKVGEALNDDGKPIKGSRILVLGAAYKKDIDDVRESPALDVIKLLEDRGGRVEYHDPYIPSVSLEHAGGHGEKQSVPLTEAAIREADCLVIITDHSTFDYAALGRQARLIVDTRNAMARAGVNSARVVSL